MKDSIYTLCISDKIMIENVIENMLLTLSRIMKVHLSLSSFQEVCISYSSSKDRGSEPVSSWCSNTLGLVGLGLVQFFDYSKNPQGVVGVTGVNIYLFYMHSLLVCLSVCLFVPNNRVKTAEPLGPKFCLVPNMTQGKFIDAQNFIKLSPKIC